MKKEEIREIIRTNLINLRTSHGLTQTEVGKKVDKRPVIEAEIDKIDSQINKLIDLYTLDKVPLTTLDNKLTELNNQKEALKEELSDMTTSLLPETEVTELLNDFSEVIKRGNLSELRIIVSALIDHIMIDGEDITIYWNF
jgi:site-specific DNA recombinase